MVNDPNMTALLNTSYPTREFTSAKSRKKWNVYKFPDVDAAEDDDADEEEEELPINNK